MADNMGLGAAKAAKQDHFFTMYEDIEKEQNAYLEFDPDVFRGKTILLPCDDPEWSNFTKYFAANFDRFGIKKLISTSYADGSNSLPATQIEKSSPFYDEEKHRTRGKLFILSRDQDGSGNIDSDDIEFAGYLEGDGDFRSEEVTRLRDEADTIATNPPFSLFRPFLNWILEANKEFSIIGNVNAITYKEVFPLLKDNSVWLGDSIHSGDRKFNVPDDYPLEAAGCGIDPDGRKFIRVKGVRWFTNLEHGGRHEPLMLDTMEHNLKFNKKLKNHFNKLELDGYPTFENCDAIEIPFTECIPSNYTGLMAVPITFLDKYCPEQFDILGLDYDKSIPTNQGLSKAFVETYYAQGNTGSIGEGHPSLGFYNRNGKVFRTYRRVLIKYRSTWINDHPDSFRKGNI